MRGSSNTVFEKNDTLYLAFLCYVNHFYVFILLPFYSDCEGVPCSYTVIFSIKLNTRVVSFFFSFFRDGYFCLTVEEGWGIGWLSFEGHVSAPGFCLAFPHVWDQRSHGR